MDLRGFMAQNAVPVENEKVVVSKRFKDENGNPLAWEIRALSADEDQAIRKNATKLVSVPGKRGLKMPETDTALYILKSCTRAVIYPDLLNADLQDSYGVKTPEDLLRTMLIPGEYAELVNKIQEINGFDFEELVEEAKN